MQQQEADVLVIGAGPSGTAAAYDLASAGHRVLIVDRQSFPRHKACAGGLSVRALDRLRYPLGDVVLSEVSRLTITRQGRTGSEIRTPVPVVAVTRRYDLDNFMLDKALAAGASFARVGRKPLAIEEQEGQVVVSWPELRVQARWVIAADGANSQVRALLTGEQARHSCMAIEADAAVPPGREDEQARCDFGAAWRGYGWFVRRGAQVNIGLYSSEVRDDAVSQQALRDYAREVYGIHELGNIMAAPVGTHGWRRRVATRRVLFTGDAAGFADTLYGEGLFCALMTGQEAAACILAHRPGRPAWVAYRRRMRFWQLRLLYIRFLSFCLYRTLPVIYPVFQRHFRKEWVRQEETLRKGREGAGGNPQ